MYLRRFGRISSCGRPILITPASSMSEGEMNDSVLNRLEKLKPNKEVQATTPLAAINESSCCKDVLIDLCSKKREKR